ncbi:MAG: sulfatase-like hydrolase/transferase [Candidatus Aminicenantes bacterium]|nr:sulfatase-like hydrolase/transferase [Candidatus Aminicenantes bacterium]
MAKRMKAKAPVRPASPLPRRRFLFRLLSAAVVLAVLTCLFGSPVKRFFHYRKLKSCNVILITLDTLRADHLSCYNQQYVKTPNLDALAAAGTVFERCISQVPLTLPAHTTILSGTYPAFHRVRDNGGFVVPEGLPLVSETLRQEGFATAAFISAYVLHSKWGLNRGWDYYGDTFHYSKVKALSLSNIQKIAGEVLPEAEAWLGKNGKKRFFSWIHLYDPHAPYQPPPPYDSLYPGNPYRGEVAYMDAELGKFFAFLKAQGLWENTLIVVTADHGEMLGEHGEDGHGFFVYEGAVHVPLIIRSPWHLPAQRVQTTVEHVDVVPTILEALGVRAGKTLQGKSLLGLAFGAAAEGFGQGLSETWYPRLHYGWAELTAITKDGFKFIEAPQEELYDLAADGPAESENLWLKRSAMRRQLKEALRDSLAAIGRGALSPAGEAALSQEDREKLAALGYLSTVVAATAKSVLIDPKTKIQVFNDMMRARSLQDAGQTGQAIELVSAILGRDPEIIDGRMLLGNLFFKDKRYGEALAVYREVIRRKPDYNFAMLNVVNCLMALKQYDQAEKEIHAFRVVFPRDPTFLQLLGQVAAQRQQLDAALDLFRQALAIDPKYAEAYTKMGEIYFQRQDLTNAERCFARAQEINPELARGSFTRALVAEAHGDWELARQAYLRELEINGQNYKAAFNLAQVYKKLGQMDEALRFFRLTTEINPGFNLAFFLIAKYDFDRRQDLEEAIAMCRRGLAIQPADKNTPHGYFLLADIYAYLSEPAKSRENFRLGQRSMSSSPNPPR